LMKVQRIRLTGCNAECFELWLKWLDGSNCNG
jgi:hypothetical protein